MRLTTHRSGRWRDRPDLRRRVAAGVRSRRLWRSPASGTSESIVPLHCPGHSLAASHLLLPACCSHPPPRSRIASLGSDGRSAPARRSPQRWRGGPGKPAVMRCRWLADLRPRAPSSWRRHPVESRTGRRRSPARWLEGAAVDWRIASAADKLCEGRSAALAIPPRPQSLDHGGGAAAAPSGRRPLARELSLALSGRSRRDGASVGRDSGEAPGQLCSPMSRSGRRRRVAVTARRRDASCTSSGRVPADLQVSRADAAQERLVATRWTRGAPGPTAGVTIACAGRGVCAPAVICAPAATRLWPAGRGPCGEFRPRGRRAADPPALRRQAPPLEIALCKAPIPVRMSVPRTGRNPARRTRRSVAQLVRAPVSKTAGRGFESLRSCHRSERTWRRRSGERFPGPRGHGPGAFDLSGACLDPPRVSAYLAATP